MRTRMVAVGGALGMAALVSACGSTTRAGGTTQAAATRPSQSSASARACPPVWSPPAGQGVAIDYVDTVRIAGHDFLFGSGTEPSAAHPVLGAPLGRVLCQLTAHQVDPAYHLQDGDATLLPVGTVIYAVAGSDPTRVVAVRATNGIHLYRTVQPAGAPSPS